MAGHPHNHDHHDDGCAEDHHNHDHGCTNSHDHGCADNHDDHHDGCAAAQRCADTTGRLASCCTNSQHPNLHRLDHRRGRP